MIWWILGGWTLCYFITYLLFLIVHAWDEKVSIAWELCHETSEFNEHQPEIVIFSILFPLGIGLIIISIIIKNEIYKKWKNLNIFKLILISLLKKKYIRDRMMEEV